MINATGPLAWLFRALVPFAMTWTVIVLVLGLSGVYGISLNGWSEETQRDFVDVYNEMMMIWVITFALIYFLHGRLVKGRA